MAKNEQMLRLKFIEELLRRRKEKGATFQEIADFLENRFEEKDALENLHFTKRTFQRDKIAMEQIFGLVVSYSKKSDVYYIDQDELDMAEQTVYDHMLLVEAFRQTKNREDVMFFQPRTAKGLEWMQPLVQAILNKSVVRFRYHKFWSEEESVRVIQPYALKEVQHRWYILASEYQSKEDENVVKAFGLDRISDLQITSTHFQHSVEGLNERYNNSFGIVATADKKCETIRLAFNKVQGNYVKTLPLHHSQKLVKETETESIFELNLVPTYDFERELLSYGSSVKIIRPLHLKNKMKLEIQEMLNNYA